ncbi:hypothetical protein FB567DRAFT_16045 [Paraphoma chrysanthemicola]|uniref:Uncharacterized protein n=1 Tax=Paraphoma chrysanthemicola TaxID=798071 RepID=A0A8K0RKB6_9PLEO|nr:hypothetical protein FB567DRAFT_16045 [Paraphoma chrysanthemicola]
MSAPPSKIHVLDKSDYTKHFVVDVPRSELAPLAPSSLRLTPKILGLSTNNFTYARLGHHMGWYDIYPLPTNTPKPYNDSKKYGRIAAWGYAEIVESTVPGLAVGQTLYGYYPITTGIETVRVKFAEHKGAKIASQLLVLDEHRQHLWIVYNRYTVCPPLKDLERTKGLDSLGWDGVVQGPWATSYTLNKYGFAWNEENRVHPSGPGEWTAQDADLRNATVVLLNASSKTAISFADSLRQNRPKEHQPLTLVGIGSPASIQNIEKTGLYDKVVLNSDHETTKAFIESTSTSRIVLLDFGAREGAAEAWRTTLAASKLPFTFIILGSVVKPLNEETSGEWLSSRAANIIVSASALKEKGIEVAGEKYFEEFFADWEGFMSRNQTMKLEWREGVEGWSDGWEALCKDEVRADVALTFKF